ncbi:MAG: HNH endonuclease [Syntrophorhabdaceae bacterium]|nr:HNH endonuclease [Syntrophorhabdaceae bacterium]
MPDSKSKTRLLYAIEVGYHVKRNGDVVSSLGRILKPWITRNGYFAIEVNCPSREVTGFVPIHRIVAYQKFGTKIFECGMYVRHLNNNRLDNSFDNIGIGTQSQNCLDRLPLDRHLHARHAAFGLRKLSLDKVDELRRDRLSGMTYKMLMKKYHIVKSTVSYIVNGKTYKD